MKGELGWVVERKPVRWFIEARLVTKSEMSPTLRTSSLIPVTHRVEGELVPASCCPTSICTL